MHLHIQKWFALLLQHYWTLSGVKLGTILVTCSRQPRLLSVDGKFLALKTSLSVYYVYVFMFFNANKIPKEEFSNDKRM